MASKTHGGKRTNAGRKPSPPRRLVSGRILQGAHAELLRRATLAGVAPSALVVEILEGALQAKEEP